MQNPKQIAVIASVSDYLFVFFSYSSLKHRLILLDGQVTALVKQRQSIRHFLCR